MACSICREPYHNRVRCPRRPPAPPPTFVREVKLKDGAGVVRLRFQGDPLKLTRHERKWLHGLMNLVDDYEGKP